MSLPPSSASMPDGAPVGASHGRPPPSLGRYLAVAVSVAITVVTAMVTAGVMMNGASFASALGVGVFAGIWGGGGSGAMVGGVFHSHRSEQAATTTAAASAS